MLETTTLTFVFCISSLTAAFAYYNLRYRKFLKEHPANL
jgi:hypothetical protein